MVAGASKIDPPLELLIHKIDLVQVENWRETIKFFLESSSSQKTLLKLRRSLSLFWLLILLFLPFIQTFYYTLGLRPSGVRAQLYINIFLRWILLETWNPRQVLRVWKLHYPYKEEEQFLYLTLLLALLYLVLLPFHLRVEVLKLLPPELAFSLSEYWPVRFLQFH